MRWFEHGDISVSNGIGTYPCPCHSVSGGLGVISGHVDVAGGGWW